MQASATPITTSYVDGGVAKLSQSFGPTTKDSKRRRRDMGT
jgi:hypothetical protein